MVAAVEVNEVAVKTVSHKTTELDVSALNPDADGDGKVSELEKEVLRCPYVNCTQFPFCSPPLP